MSNYKSASDFWCFHCEQCGLANNEIQAAGAVRYSFIHFQFMNSPDCDSKNKFALQKQRKALARIIHSESSLRVSHDDLNRWIVRSGSCEVYSWIIINSSSSRGQLEKDTGWRRVEEGWRAIGQYMRYIGQWRWWGNWESDEDESWEGCWPLSNRTVWKMYLPTHTWIISTTTPQAPSSSGGFRPINRLATELFKLWLSVSPVSAELGRTQSSNSSLPQAK